MCRPKFANDTYIPPILFPIVGVPGPRTDHWDHLGLISVSRIVLGHHCGQLGQTGSSCPRVKVDARQGR